MDTVEYERSSQTLRALRAHQIGGLPLLQPLVTALQVRAIVNKVVPSQADVELGQLVVFLVLNRLLAPQPLYEIQGWLAETVLPDVLSVDTAQAYDNRFGRALDRLYPYLGELWRRLVSRAIVVYGLDVSILHGQQLVDGNQRRPVERQRGAHAVQEAEQGGTTLPHRQCPAAGPSPLCA
ncbi:MAG: DUF4277 domain-containing protein [Caldilinea sp.]|uniref:DUF4277 domain-containing protein n=1 Tax=Caldilinea sp. TaxID=2293560 RepID=UPI002C2FFC4D|nr:DUF4277 domain-containing protein [Anaerolineales bacterium]HQY90515.1 DUF4277 domain-containing protein [Caldilinea sp.]